MLSARPLPLAQLKPPIKPDVFELEDMMPQAGEERARLRRHLQSFDSSMGSTFSGISDRSYSKRRMRKKEQQQKLQEFLRSLERISESFHVISSEPSMLNSSKFCWGRAQKPRSHGFEGVNATGASWNPCKEVLRPVHVAAKCGDYEMLRLLAAAGADVEAVTSRQRSALDLARKLPESSQRSEIIAFLQSGGKMMQVRDMLSSGFQTCEEVR